MVRDEGGMRAALWLWSGEKIVLVEGEGGGLAVDDDGVGTLF